MNKYNLFSFLNVKVVFDYEKEPEEHRKISQQDIEEVKKKIAKIQDPLCKKLPPYLEFLTQEGKKENYIEIHFPFFEFDITILLSKIKEKFLISVLDQRNSKVYGNLLFEDYPCISVEDLRKLGSWSTWSPVGLSVFKPNQ